jgi:mono/diheme cytochrome c family protein
MVLTAVMTNRRRAIVGLRAIGASVAALAAVSAASAEDIQQQRVAEGRAMVKEHCARCHAVGLDDTSPHVKAPPFRVVVERYPSENLAEALAEGIVAGHPDMPVWVLTPVQIEGFLAYLDSFAPAGKKR